MITLKTSNGDLWKISLFKEEDHFYFKDGWKKFIDAHGIKEGYSIFFKYAGNSTFTVKYFDQTGCFRDASNFTRCCKNKADKVCQTRKSVDESARNLRRSQSSAVEICSSSRVVCDDYMLVHEISDSKSSDEVVSCKRKLRERAEGGFSFHPKFLHYFCCFILTIIYFLPILIFLMNYVGIPI